MEETTMKPWNKNSALAIVIGAMALLSGCGQQNTTTAGTSQSPYLPGTGIITTPGYPAVSAGGCVPINQPIPFTAPQAYVSGVMACANYASCPSSNVAISLGASTGGGAYADSGVDGNLQLLMPAGFNPQALMAGRAAAISGVVSISPAKQQEILFKSRGAPVCVRQVVSFVTSFNWNAPGTTFGTRVQIYLESSAGTGVEELEI